MKREENERMRLNILDAVVSCKIDAAGDRVSLSKIACRAGISERTLNRYFPDKEMLLYDAAIMHLHNLYTSFAKQYLAIDKSGMNGLQRLLLLMQVQINHNKADMSFAKIFVRAYTTALRTAVYRDLPVAGYDAPIRDIVLRCIEDGVRDGSIRKDSVAVEMYLLISSNYMGLVQRLIYFYSVDFSKEEHKKELFLVFDDYIKMIEKYLRSE